MLNADWIKPEKDFGLACPIFLKHFKVNKKVKSASLKISAKGVYTTTLNGQKIGNAYMTPGWTVYPKRIQFQEYDITDLLKEENSLLVTLARGWYGGRISGDNAQKRECAIIAEAVINFTDGTVQSIKSDSSWMCSYSNITFCDIYDGQIYDANIPQHFNIKTVTADNNNLSVLVPQQGAPVIQNERIKPIKIIRTPAGETVLDFGQNLTGIIEVSINAKKGETVSLSFAEILDKNGNFYNANYRSAKCLYKYICREGLQTFAPELTFYGFRYIRIDEFPSTAVNSEMFTAVVLHTEMEQTGRISSSDALLNQLFNNIIWGQKGNYLDIPTDCPQRDERQGWLGDAQVFVRTASYNFNVQNFFRKWLTDMRLSQNQDGSIPSVVPAGFGRIGAAWGDAVTICPWQLYLTYADTDVLKEMFPAMKRWVDYITEHTTTEGLWTGHWQYGDWLELTAPFGAYKGDTREELVATAFYAHSCNIVCKTGRVLGEDISEYEELYRKIVQTFKNTYKENYITQTECVLALYFNLTDSPETTATLLAEKIHAAGDCLQTGFVGTPYLLHALSDNGYTDIAYDLLLRKDFPSWLYSVTKGATTIWEHWDGIMPDGNLWPDNMNSYNHYAYGAVGDWLYRVCGGINTVEAHPGFERVHFAPVATDKIESFCAEIDTINGTVKSGWKHESGKIIYEITTPVPATALIEGKFYTLEKGSYVF